MSTERDAVSRDEAVERLRRWAERHPPVVVTPCGVGPNPHDLRHVLSRLEEAEAARDEAIRSMSEWARKAGEAQGALLASETAGVMDGWKRRAEEAERLAANLREVLIDVADALHELRAVVVGECPSLLDEDSGGSARQSMEIDDALNRAAALTTPTDAPGGRDAG